MAGKDALVVGPCRLCRETGPLLDSHIFPKAAYRRILAGPDVEEPQSAPVRFTRESSILTNSQLHEHLLCHVCEGAFGKLEDYAFPLLSQADGTFPWLASVTPIVRTAAGTLAAQSVAVDVERLSAFGASIFWRLSVTRYTSLRLGPYEEAFRVYSLGQTAFPASARLAVTLIDHSRVTFGRVDRLFGFHNAKREHGYTLHQLAILGVDMKLYVGALLPPSLDLLSFPHSKRVFVRSADELAKELAPQLATSPAKGLLARSEVNHGS
jgi:hypothetical protein